MDVKQYIDKISFERSKLFFLEALKHNIDVKVVSEKYRITKLSFKNKNFFILNDNFSLNTTTTIKITRNKEITKLVLDASDINVPHGIEVNTSEEVLSAIKNQTIKYPIVIKPIDSAKGAGVSMNISDENSVRKAVDFLKTIKKNNKLMEADNFIAEEMVYGNDHRVLMLNGEAIACIKRIPAHVIGNGKKTISELIEQFNTTRSSEYFLHTDDDLLQNLKEQNLSLNSILGNAEKVFVRNNANISSGGVAVDYTDTISKRFKKISADAARSINGTFVGIDLFVEDITSEALDQNYNIIEINGAPDYDIHEQPVLKDSGANIAKSILEYIFQENL